jgi:hypothetical protein
MPKATQATTETVATMEIVATTVTVEDSLRQHPLLHIRIGSEGTEAQLESQILLLEALSSTKTSRKFLRTIAALSLPNTNWESISSPDSLTNNSPT